MIPALAAAGIASILLKGASIASWLYGEGERRTYGDLDLLVSPDDMAHAGSVAESLGFRHFREMESTRIDSESHHEIWIRDLDAVVLELHRSFVGIGVPDDVAWDELSRHVEPMALGVGEFAAPVLAVPARALLVALHAAVHGAKGQTLNDLERALERLPAATWAEAAVLARRLHAEPAFAIGLSFVPDGAELADRLIAPEERRASVETLLWATSAPSTAMGWERLARTRGLGAKLRYAVRELAPPPELLRHVDGRARRGPLGRAGAYLRRPIRLLRQAPRGFGAWRAVRRKTND